MKRTIKILMLLLITAMLTTSLLATDIETPNHVHEHDNITIILPEMDITKAERDKIITYLITGEQPTTRNILCNLFGHDMEYTGSGIITVSHRVYSTAPRCLQQTHDIYSCSRCGELSSKLIGSFPMNCCS